MVKVAFIGLGVMGYPMAGHLKVRGGHEVAVYNRTLAKAEKWVAEFGGMAFATPAKAAKNADFVFTCVGNDDDLRAVTTAGDGVIEAMKPGAVLVDHTTASAEVARELDAAAGLKGCGFVDAPVSGGQAGAENGVLTIMCGGDGSSFEKVKPVMKAYARMIGLMGATGSGQLAKMVNQICVAGVVQGLAEAIHFGTKAGLDMEAVIAVISKGAAGSWQMDNRHKTMIAGKYDLGFAVDWMRKDLDIVLSQARRNGAKLPVTALIDQFYRDVQDMGGNRWDTSSLLARLERK